MPSLGPRILVTGASGQLGSHLLRALQGRRETVVAWSGSTAGELLDFQLRPVDLRDETQVIGAFREARPDVVLHTAARAAVADCYRDPAGAAAVNVQGSVLLARLAADSGVRMVHVSTDLVFDGEQAPYREEDPCAPLSIYGRSKAEAEQQVLAFPGVVVVRVSLLFGPSLTARPTFFDGLRQALVEGRPVHLFADEWRTPLDLPTAAGSLLAIAASDCTGLLHLGGPERLSRLEMGQRLARVLACAAHIVPTRRNDGQTEPRPRDVSLDSSRWRRLFPEQPWPPFEEAVRVFPRR